MRQNTYEKSLTKVDHNIFSRIKLFFRNLLKRNPQESMVIKNTREENHLAEQIKIPDEKQDWSLEKVKEELQEPKVEEVYLQRVEKEKQKLSFKKIREGFESGELIEEDLCELELQELREFYLQQIEEKKQSIEKYKNKIMNIKTQLDWS